MSMDVVVIGAGLQGCGVALRLAQAGRDVVVLERSIPGAEASSAAGGILSPGVEAEPGPFHDLCEQSMGRWRSFAEEVERLSGTWIGFRAGGTLEVSVDDRFTPVLAARAAQLERAGIDVEASVDPRLLGRALHAAAARAGARFVQGQVRGIAIEGGRVVGVDHDSGRIPAGAVVLAAGAWSMQVEGNGLPAGAVRPVRGQIAVLDTRPPLLSRVIFSDKGYVVPRPDGRVLCGSTMEEAGFEKAVTAGGLLRVLELAVEVAPALASAPVVETWSNFRPATPDGLPILGPGRERGLFYATGHYRNGVLLTPITADAVSDAVLERPPPVDLAPFGPARLSPRGTPR
jgi:glycine oxidase